MCNSAINSSVCPGPKAGSGADTRCRGCRKLAGQFSHKIGMHPTKVVSWAQKRTELATQLAGQNARKAGVGLGINWSRFADTFLIEVFDDACNSLPTGRFALAVAGSLARMQATPYSDMEYFFVVQNEDLVGSFNRMACKMWKSLGVVTQATGSFSEDLFFSENSSYNVLTPVAKCLAYNHDTKAPDYDAPLQDMLEQFSFGDAAYEQLNGARCIAGDATLLELLKQNLRNHKHMSPTYEFRDRLNTNVIPELQQLKRGLEQGDRTINIKAVILRTLLWMTIGLGRYYGIHGVGDVAHLKELLSRRKLSNTVFKMMMDALNYAQAARFQTHLANRKESDVVQLTPELKKCLRTVSALVEMCDVWLKQKSNKAVGRDNNRDCFRTSHPDRYDYFQLKNWTK
jgi:hypothetical protein